MAKAIINSDEGIGQRLKDLLEAQEMSNYQLAREIGKNDSTISRIINKNSKPHKETLRSICNVFRVNEKWLLTGRGAKNIGSENASKIAIKNILVDDKDYVEEGRNKFIRVDEGNYFMLTPFIRKTDQLEFVKECDDPHYINQLPINPYMVTKPLQDFYISFEVVGDDMIQEDTPSIEEGFIGTAQAIDKSFWTSRFVFKRNKLYLIVHKEGIILREIKKACPEEKCLEVHAYNPAYEDQKIQLKNCKMICEVIGLAWRI
jgi:transcriptional regulator with XRE-family HTH domain